MARHALSAYYQWYYRTMIRQVNSPRHALACLSELCHITSWRSGLLPPTAMISVLVYVIFDMARMLSNGSALISRRHDFAQADIEWQISMNAAISSSVAIYHMRSQFISRLDWCCQYTILSTMRFRRFNFRDFWYFGRFRYRATRHISTTLYASHTWLFNAAAHHIIASCGYDTVTYLRPCTMGPSWAMPSDKWCLLLRRGRDAVWWNRAYQLPIHARPWRRKCSPWMAIWQK